MANQVNFYSQSGLDGVIFRHNLQKKVKVFDVLIADSGQLVDSHDLRVGRSSGEELIIFFRPEAANKCVNRILQLVATVDSKDETEDQLLLDRALKKHMVSLQKDVTLLRKQLKKVNASPKVNEKRKPKDKPKAIKAQAKDKSKKKT